VTDDGPWYFALNNRRLWVLKRCREQGLLMDNQILVRVRAPKSQAERERYTLDKCVVEAKVMRVVAAAAGSDKTENHKLDLGHELLESLCVGVDDGKETPTIDRKDREDDELDSDRDADNGDDDDDDSEDDTSSFCRVRVDNPFDALS
jgi:hypothetical protein